MLCFIPLVIRESHRLTRYYPYSCRQFTNTKEINTWAPLSVDLYDVLDLTLNMLCLFLIFSSTLKMRFDTIEKVLPRMSYKS